MASLVRIIAIAALAAALVAALVVPAGAIKVYVNPSVQTSNYSPDGAYQEAANMQDVAARLMDKLLARGFQARNSAWLNLAQACADSDAWGADCFVALHTDATGSTWSSTHGTRAFYYQSSGGWYNPACVSFAQKIANKVSSKLAAFGRGYNLGTMGDYPWLGYNMYVLANQSAVPSTLVEGLYHTNYDDVYDALLLAAGRDAYAQGVFEGICDYYGWSYVAVKRVPCIVSNQDGRLQAFVLGRADGNLYTCYQTAVNSSTFTSWTPIGVGGYAGNPSAVLDSTGVITVAIRHQDGSIRSLWQTAPNAYTSWNTGSWGGNVPGDPKIVLNQNGNRQIFVRGGSNLLHTRYETSRGNWSDWNSIGVGSYAGNPSVILDSYGILTIAIRHTDGSVRSLWQTTPNGYLSWGTGSWGGNVPNDPVLAINQNGMRQLFVTGGGHYLHTRYENPRGTWADWTSIGAGAVYSGNPVVICDSGGRLNVFIREDDANLGVIWQTNPNSYTTWSLGGLDGVIINDAAVAKQANGLRRVIALDTIQDTWTRYETSAGVWAGWSIMSGSP